MKLTGSCLCGELKFEINSSNGKIYQCHCSKCRKVTGTSANANIIVKIEGFSWLKQPQTLQKYLTSEDWETAFCSKCGSQAPIKDETNKVWYVPAGSLNQDKGLKVTSHIYVGSKASWDVISGGVAQNDAGA